MPWNCPVLKIYDFFQQLWGGPKIIQKFHPFLGGSWMVHATGFKNPNESEKFPEKVFFLVSILSKNRNTKKSWKPSKCHPVGREDMAFFFQARRLDNVRLLEMKSQKKRGVEGFLCEGFFWCCLEVYMEKRWKAVPEKEQKGFQTAYQAESYDASETRRENHHRLDVSNLGN